MENIPQYAPEACATFIVAVIVAIIAKLRQRKLQPQRPFLSSLADVAEFAAGPAAAAEARAQERATDTAQRLLEMLALGANRETTLIAVAAALLPILPRDPRARPWRASVAVKSHTIDAWVVFSKENPDADVIHLTLLEPPPHRNTIAEVQFLRGELLKVGVHQ